MTPRIRLVVRRPDGRCSDTDTEILGIHITSEMLEAAEDLLHALICGERRLPTAFYDLCASAFGTTPDDAKKRRIGAVYGKRGGEVGR